MISAILLGAGVSKRMGVDKLSLPWGSKTILEQCFETLLRSNVQELVVVLGIRNKELKNFFQRRKVKVVVNPRSKRGMGTSIRRGLETIRSTNGGILIALGDQPFLKTRTVNALIHAFDQGKGGIIVPSFRGRRGHPVIFHKRYKKELLSLKGDVGGRSIIERYPEDVRVVPVKAVGVAKDVDTWQDYSTPSPGYRPRSRTFNRPRAGQVGYPSPAKGKEKKRGERRDEKGNSDETEKKYG